VELADWIVAARIPYEAVASVSRQVIRSVIIACALVLAVITFLASAIFSSLSLPLARLSHAAASIRGGDFTSRLRDPYRDEVGEVSRAMDEASERMEALVEEIRQGQEEKRRAEIEMLKSQISPHFLFNTLDSLKWTAMLRGDGLVAEGIGALSSLLRNGALASEETASLELELENLRSYCLIMKLRYGEAFRLEIEASEDALRCRLPRLLLQPIVENAIIHGGAEASLALVTISVLASVEGGSLAIRIEDDGKGFDQEAPAPKGGSELEAAAEAEERFSGIGLRNVAARLRLQYGLAGTLRVESARGQGTRVAIRLPAFFDGPAGDSAAAGRDRCSE
jgi:Predicted signal transduction protein with a C-terminal ATPase domain